VIYKGLLFASLSAFVVSGCVSKEQMERNNARHEVISQGKSFELAGCETENGKNSCFEQAKAQCAQLGQEYSWMYQTKGQASKGLGEITVKCLPRGKDA